MTYPSETLLPPEVTPLALRAASEGIPVCAISRILGRPQAEVFGTLSDGVGNGSITHMPPPDWPPTAKNSDRTPLVSPTVTNEDLLFACRKELGLTNLEAAFFVLLLKAQRANKEKLHAVIETQRMKRSSTPDKLELTDPKMVDVMICKLRKKLRDLDPVLKITTIWGGGYYLDPETKERVMERLNDAGRPVSK